MTMALWEMDAACGLENFYPTPAPLAARMWAALDVPSGAFTVLDPSAGDGALLHFAPPTARVVAVEIHPLLCERLMEALTGAEVWSRNFLDATPEELGRFDRVIMSPPFRGDWDVRHVEHAAQFIAPGGRLVAVVTRRGAATLIRDLGGVAEELPSQTYGTDAPRPSNALTSLFVLGDA